MASQSVASEAAPVSVEISHPDKVFWPDEGSDAH